MSDPQAFKGTPKKMKKTHYKELPINAVIDVYDDENWNVDIWGQFGLDSKVKKKVKEEDLLVDELNAKFETKMKVKMA